MMVAGGGLKGHEGRPSRSTTISTRERRAESIVEERAGCSLLQLPKKQATQQNTSPQL